MADASNSDDEETLADAAVDTFEIENDAPDQIVELRFSPALRGLYNFINNADLITEKGDKNTNVINNRYKKTYNIPATFIEEFFTWYEACRRTGKVLNYAERQETAEVDHSGIMIDLDIYQYSHDQIVTVDHITRLVSNIAHVIYTTVVFPAEDYFKYHIFVIRKPEVKPAPGTDHYKDGIHLLIPEIFITKAVKQHILAEIERCGYITASFSNIVDQLVDVATILDKGSTRNPVNFFGSVKPAKPQPPAYVLTQAYSVNTQLFPNVMIALDQLPVDAISSGTHPLTGAPINTAYELALSFALESISGSPTWLQKMTFECRPELETELEIAAQRADIPEDQLEDADNDVDILTLGNAEAGYLKKLLDILHISYAIDYNKWIKVIFAIANTSPRYRPLAVRFSQRAPEAYSESAIDRVWNEGLSRTTGQPLTKRSIIYWAYTSSPEKFRELDKSNYVGILATALYYNEGKISHADIARVMYAMIGNKFVSDVPRDDPKSKDREWYEFILPEQKHQQGEVFKWRPEYSPDNLHNFIADHMPKLFDEIIRQMEDRKDAADSVDLQKYWKNIIAKTKDSRLKLGDDGFQTKVLKQCEHRFRMRGFTRELDDHPMIIGVGNGVLKLGAKPELVQGFHEYKISKYTRTNYVPYDPTNTCIQDIEAMTHDIYVEPDAHEYIMKFVSTWLDKRESAGIMLNFDGSGRNGKTTVAKLAHNALGNDYVLIGRSSLLTDHNEKAQGANEAQVAMEDKHGAYFDEFKENAELNMARVKAIVNPGWQTGRGVYKREHNFRNTCNPITITNFRLVVREHDHGTWRRLKAYTCKTRFTENPQKSHERKNNYACSKIWPTDARYLEAMLSILVHYYQRLCIENEGDIEKVYSPTIEYETERFRTQQDSVDKFILQICLISPDSEPITLDAVAERYLRWNGNDRPKQLQIESAMDLFRNSRIADRVEKRDDNVEFVNNLRLKINVGDEMLPGEASFALAKLDDDDDIIVEAPGADDDDDYAEEDADDEEVRADKLAAAKLIAKRNSRPKPVARTEKEIAQLQAINNAIIALSS